MNNMKRMISKMYKEHSHEHLYAGEDAMSIGIHYMPEVLYEYVKRRHFDTIKNGGYTNTITMDAGKANDPYDFVVTSDIMDCNPYASSISFRGKDELCLHIEFEFVCKHRIMMPFSKTIRRMMNHYYISNRSSSGTGKLIYGKFEGKDLDVIMKCAKSITDIIVYINEYMLTDPKNMNCWSDDNVTIDDYYKVVKNNGS